MKVRIYSPSKNAMQSGRAKTGIWVIEPDPTSPSEPEPLMGWSRSADTPALQLRMKFPSLEAAINFADKKGWEYSFDDAHDRKIVPKNYGDRFR